MNEATIRGLCLDSRKICPGDLFFAVKGEAVDGRQFIQDALDRGAVAVLLEKDKLSDFHLPLAPNVPFIEYSNLKQAIGFIAARFYNAPSSALKVIGITGTNGKTSCSHFIAELFSLLGKSCGVMGTLGLGFLDHLKPFGLTTADAVTVQANLAALLAESAEFLSMEVTSHALMQDRVAGVDFHTTVFTNLTRDHLDYHGSLENYFEAKKRLFTAFNSKFAIINLDDECGCTLMNTPLHADTVKIGYTTTAHHAKADITLEHLDLNHEGMKAFVKTPWGEGAFSSPLLGKFNLSNLLASLAAVCVQGIPFKEVLSVIPKLHPVPGRMVRLKHNQAGPEIIIDYAHTPDALKQVLMALRPHCKAALWCVFGCGGDRDRGKRPLMAEVAEAICDHIIVTQDNPRTEDPHSIIEDILKGFSRMNSVTVEFDRAQAISLAVEKAAVDDLIIIAGKGHETYQIINTEKIPFSDEQCAVAALTRRQLSWAH